LGISLYFFYILYKLYSTQGRHYSESVAMKKKIRIFTYYSDYQKYSGRTQ